MSVSATARVADLAAPLESLARRAAEHSTVGRLVVLAGPSGCGRTRVLDRVRRLHDGPTLAGGGLAGLRTVPAFALTRALRMPVPTEDAVAAAEFVLAATGRATLLVLDDLHLADVVTLEIVGLLAGQLPMIVAVADDTASGASTVATLRALPQVVVEPVPSLGTDDARAIAQAANRDLGAEAQRAVVEAAGGNPGALVALAADPLAPDLRVAVAERLLAAGTEARTALCLIGLLGRPAGTDLVDASLVSSAVAAGLVRVEVGAVIARSPLDLDVAVRMLTDEHRRSLHAFLASRVGDPGEQARHHEAAGNDEAAAEAAGRAAEQATTMRVRIGHLAVGARTSPPPIRADTCLAVALVAGDCADHRLAVALADAAEAAGAVGDPRSALVRARAALAAGDATRALAELDGAAQPSRDVGSEDEVAILVAVERGRALCLVDPVAAMGVASEAFGSAWTNSLRARAAGVLGAAQLAAGVDGWEATLEAAELEARASGLDDVALAAAANRCSGYLQLGAAADAHALAQASRTVAATAGATGWARRFEATGLWVTVQVRAALAEGRATGTALLDAVLPAALRCEVAAQVALAQADGGDLAAASAGLAGLDVAREELLAWCAAELAALGGDTRNGREKAAAVLAHARRWPIPAFAALTASWAGGSSRLADSAHVGGSAFELAALAERATDPPRAAALFRTAARQWVGYSGRSVLRCRVAAAIAAAESQPDDALAELRDLAGELDGIGLALLGAQVTRARRRLGDTQLPATGTGPRGAVLSRREYEVLAAVGAGATSTAIAARLGVAPSTVETHVKSAMRKLGAATRTEAAVRAAQLARP